MAQEGMQGEKPRLVGICLAAKGGAGDHILVRLPRNLGLDFGLDLHSSVGCWQQQASDDGETPLSCGSLCSEGEHMLSIL